MTKRNNRIWLSAAGATALATLMLSGCAGSHVGDAWQCPLAQGEVCASVATADPAVSERTVDGNMAVERPRYDQDGASHVAGTMRPGQAAEEDCESDCGPLGWLAGLFADIAGDAGSGQAEHAASAQGDDTATEVAVDPDRTPSVPAAAAPNPPEDLRAPETIGRVWIAPFVDADGVYREGSWVRVVIAPAAWRLP